MRRACSERYDKIKTDDGKNATIQEGRIIMAEMINDKTMDEIEILQNFI